MITDDAIWDAYNLLLLGPDIERLRKMLVRYDLFRMTLDVPGDIVECGVFKGSGLLYWLKLLTIYAQGSAKRVVGFDLFSGFPEPELNNSTVQEFIQETQFEGTSLEGLYNQIRQAGIDQSRCELVEGDVRATVSDYNERNPGFRISLLHLDLDLAEGTQAALEAFWPRVVAGGIVVFDEYAISRWTESSAVDRFFAGKSIKLKTLPWARTPTAYLIKENYD